MCVRVGGGLGSTQGDKALQWETAKPRLTLQSAFIHISYVELSRDSCHGSHAVGFWTQSQRAQMRQRKGGRKKKKYQKIKTEWVPGGMGRRERRIRGDPVIRAVGRLCSRCWEPKPVNPNVICCLDMGGAITHSKPIGCLYVEIPPPCLLPLAD